LAIVLDGTNGETFPSWTTSTRPATPVAGQMGYNTTTGNFDAYTASGWVSLASSNGGVLTGNLQFGTSNAGIVFDNSSALTNSTLNDYEVGTWTPVLNPAVGTITSQTTSGVYVKVGKLVILSFSAQITGGTVSSISTISGFPFAALTGNNPGSGICREFISTGYSWNLTTVSGATYATLFLYNNATGVTNSYGWNGTITYQATF
jgi:hypothetical protein